MVGESQLSAREGGPGVLGPTQADGDRPTLPRQNMRTGQDTRANRSQAGAPAGQGQGPCRLGSQRGEPQLTARGRGAAWLRERVPGALSVSRAEETRWGPGTPSWLGPQGTASEIGEPPWTGLWSPPKGPPGPAAECGSPNAADVQGKCSPWDPQGEKLLRPLQAALGTGTPRAMATSPAAARGRGDPSVHSEPRTRKPCSLHTRECDSALKRKDFLTPATLWMNLGTPAE